MNPIDLLLSRMVVFDEESGGGEVTDESTTQTPKNIGDELNNMFKEIEEATETPKIVDPKDIDLELEKDTDLEEEGKPKTSEEETEDEKLAAKASKEEAEKIKKEKEEEDEKPSAIDEMRKDFNDFASTQLKAAGITSEEALTGDGKGEKKKVEKVAEKVEEPILKDTTIKPLELSDELWEKVKDDKGAFVELMNNIQKGIASAVKEEVLLESIPVLHKYTRNYITSVNQVEIFYRENPELNPYRVFVGYIAAKLGQEKPELNKDQIIETAGKETYRILKLTKGKAPPDNGTLGKTKPPAFGETGTRKGKPGEKVYKNKIQKELEEMNAGRR